MRYLLGVIAFIVLLVIAVVTLVSRDNDQPNETANQAGTRLVVLSEEAKDGKVILTINGKVVGEEQHRSIRITISHTNRILEVLRGYEFAVDKNQTFSNNDAAYDVFLHALDNAGFIRERNFTPRDERGVCPLGNQFIYELKDSTDIKLWSTSCNSKEGTFAGQAKLIQDLFKAQIPDYSKLVSGVRLN